MESLDAAGKLRERILRLTPEQKIKRRNLPVVDDTEVRGQVIDGVAQLQQLLVEQHADDFAEGFSAAMLSFALGRPLSYHEDEAVSQLAEQFRASDYKMAALIEAIILRPEFRHPLFAE
ncbi:MAG: DUF1585 domain-containing protein [Verrucomicrobiota bacterium]